MSIILLFVVILLYVMLDFRREIMNVIFRVKKENSYAENLKYISKGIVSIAKDSSPLITTFKGITFSQVRVYAEKAGIITQRNINHFKFEIDIHNIKYYVSVSRSKDGSNCAVLHSETDSARFLRDIENLPPIGKRALKPIDTSLTVIEKLEFSYNKHKKTCSW